MKFKKKSSWKALCIVIKYKNAFFVVNKVKEQIESQENKNDISDINFNGNLSKVFKKFAMQKSIINSKQ